MQKAQHRTDLEKELEDLESKLGTPGYPTKETAARIDQAVQHLATASALVVSVGKDLGMFQMMRLGALVQGLFALQGVNDEASLEAIAEIVREGLKYNSDKL